MCLSLRVCHRCICRLLASERVFIHILTGDAPVVSPDLPVRHASLPTYHEV